MDLATYITSQGGTGKPDCPVIASLAKASGCHPGTVYQISLGLRVPSIKLGRRLRLSTGNAVDLDTMIPALRDDYRASLAAGASS